MKNGIYKWVRKRYNSIVGSIAFFPAITAVCFLVLSWLMLELDYSPLGKTLKSQFNFIRLQDASTARSIASTILAGILSLTVFSFSMVMIVLNQTASQMSNRTLESMISNRFQQMVLGFYIGTIVYGLFLLSAIRDIDSGVYVPALSIYLLLLLTVTDIFLFIYFLHYVTQSVKYETIIKRIHKQTLHSINKAVTDHPEDVFVQPTTEKQTIVMPHSHYFQDFENVELAKFACRHNGVVQFLHPKGTYLLQGTPLLHFYSSDRLDKKDIKNMMTMIDFYTGQPVEKNAFYGFHQISEVAIKALSPGINDPETAVLSLHSLTNLFQKQLQCPPQILFYDKDGKARIASKAYSFQELFMECFYPIWDYGKKDRYIQSTLLNMIQQLQQSDTGHKHEHLLGTFILKIKEQMLKNVL